MSGTQYILSFIQFEVDAPNSSSCRMKDGNVFQKLIFFFGFVSYYYVILESKL
jgi:hypothetical protein